jgi:transposase
MKRFVEGADRGQSTLLPECLDDFIDEINPARAIDAFVEALDLGALGFAGVEPAATGRPSYHPSALLKLYIYGYLNRVQSSRRLEREAGRNVEVMWLLGRLIPDDKVIAGFRKDNGKAIRTVCARFVDLCREMGLLTTASVAIDGSKFKAVNNRDKNFTRGKMERRRAQLEESVARYLSQLDTADRHEPTAALHWYFSCRKYQQQDQPIGARVSLSTWRKLLKSCEKTCKLLLCRAGASLLVLSSSTGEWITTVPRVGYRFAVRLDSLSEKRERSLDAPDGGRTRLLRRGPASP